MLGARWQRDPQGFAANPERPRRRGRRDALHDVSSYASALGSLAVRGIADELRLQR